MSNSVAIRVEGLSKAYRIGLKEQRHETMLGAMVAWVKSPLSNFRDLRKLSRFDDAGTQPQVSGSSPQLSSMSPQLSPFIPQPSSLPSDVIWALKDVSFDVKHGEAIGIIGRNGAGKSTLLKILSRITEPTRGRAQVFGRVGSLLEVGTGFHPDLTGRENVYLNGTILGMKKREVDAKFDEIVEFSGVEKFIDTPVKRYSSGMRVRLGFSVAAHLEPEILIIDEVLAVGDLSFQKKCLGKMGDVARGGRTVLFVSHNMTAVQTLCSRGVWLDNGSVKLDGRASEVVTAYIQAGEQITLAREWPDDETAPGSQQIRLLAVRVLPQDGDDLMSIAKPVRLAFELKNSIPGCLLNISCHIYNQEGVMAFNAFSAPQNCSSGLLEFDCTIPANLFNDGLYAVEVMVVVDAGKVVAKVANCVSFELHDPRQRVGWMGKYPGVMRPATAWAVGSARTRHHG